MQHILMAVDTACGYDRNLSFILFSKLIHKLNDTVDLLLIAVFLECGLHVFCIRPQLRQLFSGKPQVSSGQRAFNDHKIRGHVVFPVPHLADNRD